MSSRRRVPRRDGPTVVKPKSSRECGERIASRSGSDDAAAEHARPVQGSWPAIRLRHRSRKTETAYVGWIRRFILFHGKRHPKEMGAPEVERFLSSLAVEGGVSASTQNQALAAILFLYRGVLGSHLPWMDGIVRARKPERLPVVLTRQEVAALLGELAGRERLMATLLYGSGLRLLECIRLRVKEIDFAKREILVRAGKGDKDRMTMLPEAAREPLTLHLEGVRRQYESDVERGFGGATLPGAIGRKYPNAGREWAWQYVFPASRLCVDPASGDHRRHHLDESVLQRAVREAARRARIPKSASCHTLRHYSASRTMPSDVEGHSRWVGNRASKQRWDRPITRHSFVGSTDC
jgi:integron integrase